MRDFRQRKARLATLPPEEAAQDPLSQDKFGDRGAGRRRMGVDQE